MKNYIWTKVMAGLEDHFGDNAELDNEHDVHIPGYGRRED